MCFENELQCISKAFELPSRKCAVKKSTNKIRITRLHIPQGGKKGYISVFQAANNYCLLDLALKGA